MAVSPTFKKRQRENKLREKAQMKREHRQQRAMEKKLSRAADPADSTLPVFSDIERASSYDEDGESNS